MLRIQQGKFALWDAQLSSGRAGFSRVNQLTGWWHGVTTGDLDGDGRLDIVASNWGKNSRYIATPERPWKMYFGDLAKAERIDLIEARWNPDLQKEVPERGWRLVRSALPFLWEKVSTYEGYGRSSVDELYAGEMKALRTVAANTVTTMVLFNRGTTFEAVDLPEEAQWAPAFGVCVADANGDGSEDVFLNQNFFCLNPEAERQDAGRGLWLR